MVARSDGGWSGSDGRMMEMEMVLLGIRVWTVVLGHDMTWPEDLRIELESLKERGFGPKARDPVLHSRQQQLSTSILEKGPGTCKV